MQKKIYHQINKDQLISFLKTHPVFFTLHYLVIVSGLLGAVLVVFLILILNTFNLKFSTDKFYYFRLPITTYFLYI